MFAKSILGAAMGALLIATPALSAPPNTNFAGRWKLVPAQSRNLGMMAAANMTTTIEQTPGQLVVDDSGTFDGQVMVEHTTYGLSGAASQNNSPMTGLSTGKSHWEDGRLITEWERPGAISGSVIHRTEVRRMGPDGRSMIVEIVRTGKDPLVMVFARQ